MRVCENFCVIVANVLNSDIIVGEFEHHLYFCIHFWTNTLGNSINPHFPFSYGLNSSTTVLLQRCLLY